MEGCSEYQPTLRAAIDRDDSTIAQQTVAGAMRATFLYFQRNSDVLPESGAIS